jgi:hypothetical protein
VPTRNPETNDRIVLLYNSVSATAKAFKIAEEVQKKGSAGGHANGSAKKKL